MKLSRIFFLLLLLFLLVPSITSAQKKDDGFQTFFAKFRQAVVKNDKTAVKNMMASNFEWALDGYISRNEAWGYVDAQTWKGLQNAVSRTPVACKNNYCNNRSGYHVWSSKKYRTEIMFEKINGTWKWSALLGD